MATIDRPKLNNNGSWSFRIRIDNGYSSTGDRLKRITKTYKSKPGIKEKTAYKEAEKYAYELEEKVKRGLFTDDKRTLSEYMDYVLDTKLSKGLIKRNTYDGAKRNAERIKRYIGDIKLTKLLPSDIEYMLSQIQKEGNRINGKELNNKTLKEYYLLVSSTCDWAFQQGLVHENIVKRVRAPKISKNETEYYNIDQVKAILKAIDEETIRNKAFISVLFFTGLRKGEVLGLEWKNFNESERFITVEKTYNYNSTDGLFFDTPKTEKSKRTVCLPESVVKTLKEYRRWQIENQILKYGEYFQDGGYIFTQENGLPIHPDNVNRILKEVERNHPELPHLKCHTFRHSVASYLIYEGHDVVTVSKMLGHASISTTLNYYAHAMPKGQRELADSLESFSKRA